MRVYTLLFLSLLLGYHLHAQQPAEKKHTRIDASKQPLVFVDSFVTILPYMILDPKKIQSINVLKDSSAVNRFGQKGSNGVVLIKTRKNTTLVRLPALLDAFSFPDSLRHLRVNINEAIINNKALLLFDPTEVVTIKTRAMPKWPDARSNEEETFISITVKNRRNN